VGVGVAEPSEETAHAAEVETVVRVCSGASRHARALVVAQPLHVLEEIPEPTLLVASGHCGRAEAAAAPPQYTAREAESDGEAAEHPSGPSCERGGGCRRRARGRSRGA